MEKWEGGFVNDPKDSGGMTKYGISKRAYPNLDIANLTKEQAKEIYKNDYWKASAAHRYNWPMCLAVFDAAVNVGVSRARRWLALHSDFESYMRRRESFYERTAQIYPKNRRFLRGWLNRTADLRKYANDAS